MLFKFSMGDTLIINDEESVHSETRRYFLRSPSKAVIVGTRVWDYYTSQEFIRDRITGLYFRSHDLVRRK